MSDTNDPEEIKKRLRELGVPVDSWGESSGGEVMPPMLERQKKLLLQVRDLLQAQLERDLEEVATLHETLGRLKHGGGN